MSNKLHRLPSPPDENGCILQVSPGDAGWSYVGFSVYRLRVNQSITQRNAGVETCAVVLSGTATFEVDSKGPVETTYRESPFDSNRWAMYAPTGAVWTITAVKPLEVAVGSALASHPKDARIIKPQDVVVQKRGSGSNTRYVADLLPEDQDCADKLLVVEAFTPAGNWSSYPPHKHDQDHLPSESKLEEVYYHRIKPSSGFAVQRVYTDDRSLDETMSVSDGDVVLVPRGYHPVGAPHGYDLYYLNIMAGPLRKWRTHVDPAHAWLLKS